MAHILKETFKGKIEFILYSYSNFSFVLDRLLSELLIDDFQTLPSPEELKYKVLVRVRIIILFSI